MGIVYMTDRGNIIEVDDRHHTITIGKLKVVVKEEMEGVVVDIYPTQKENDPPIQSMYTFFNEVDEG